MSETPSKKTAASDEAAGSSIEKGPEAAQASPVVQVIQAGEDDVLAEIVGDRWGTNRTAAGFAQIANSRNRGGVRRHD